MAKCNFCHQRKGKRQCPVLKGVICALCCGENRGNKIQCHVDCHYLNQHGSYQRERGTEYFFKKRGAFLRSLYKKGGDKAINIVNLLDMLTYSEFHNNPDTPDMVVIEGLEYVKQKLSPIETPTNFVPSFGEILWDELDDYLSNKTEDTDITSETVDKNIAFIKEFSNEKDATICFVAGITAFIERFFPDIATNIQANKAPQHIIIP